MPDSSEQRREHEAVVRERDRLLAELETVRNSLAGPVHGRIQVLRGMCTDEQPHVWLDVKLLELANVVDQTRSVLARSSSAVRSEAGADADAPDPCDVPVSDQPEESSP